jgi:hypothetical protein
VRVAIDLSSAAKRSPTGIGRYQVELVRAMAPMLSVADEMVLTTRLKRWTARRHLGSVSTSMAFAASGCFPAAWTFTTRPRLAAPALRARYGP